MVNFQGYLTLLSSLVTICCATSSCNGNINRNGIKKLYHDRCVSGEIIGEAYGMSLLDCVENCLITKGCSSIQYSRALFKCLKSSENISTDIPKKVCRGEVSSARDHWTEGFPDPCQSVDCLTGSLCKVDLHGNVSTCEVPEKCELPLLHRLNWQFTLDDCDAYGGRKVRFMSKETLRKLISLDNVCTFKAEIVVRLKLNNEQKEVMLAQHSNYSNKHNLTFLLNDHQEFNAPVTKIIPYFYLGFLPISTARFNTTQGYRANDIDFSFNNCDANPNSYIVFYTGEQNINYTTAPQSSFMMGWIDHAKLVPAARYLPDHYFMKFEMHMGGCGGLMRGKGAAVGCIIGQ